MKWQPNEIDGFYFSEIDGKIVVYPVEAKALSTQDDINLVQLKGGVETVISKFKHLKLEIIPLAVQMVNNGIRIAIFDNCNTTQTTVNINLKTAIEINFAPAIKSWL